MHFNNIKTDQKVWPDVQKPSRTFDFSISIGSTELKVYYQKAGRAVTINIFDGKHRIGVLDLLPGSEIPAYSVADAVLSPAYQGHGIMGLLYRILIEDYGLAIYGEDHSLGARKMWSRLAARKGIAAYGVFDAYRPRFEPIRLTPSSYTVTRNGKQRLFIEERDSVAVLLTKVGSPFQRYIQKSIALEQEKRKLKTPDISKFTISE